MVIVIDPGHGGRQPGAVSGGTKEKDIALALSLDVADKLSPHEVILTREYDSSVSLAERIEIANEEQAACFISLHHNAGGGHGFESYLAPTAGKEAQRYRDIIHARIMETLQDYNIRDRGKKVANFFVLRRAKVPAILLECLFLDNERERGLLLQKNFRLTLAAAIATGIKKALSLTSLPTEKGFFTVQIGAFRERENAEAVLAQAQDKGFRQSFIRPFPL